MADHVGLFAVPAFEGENCGGGEEDGDVLEYLAQSRGLDAEGVCYAGDIEGVAVGEVVARTYESITPLSL